MQKQIFALVFAWVFTVALASVPAGAAWAAQAAQPGRRPMPMPQECPEECQAQIDELNAGQAQQNEMLAALTAEVEQLQQRIRDLEAQAAQKKKPWWRPFLDALLPSASSSTPTPTQPQRGGQHP